MIKSLNGKSSIKKSYGWTSFAAVFLFLVLGIFFAFKTFGKTTHSIEFTVNGIEEFSIDDVLDIKAYKEDKTVETVRGGKITVNDGESLNIQVSLNEGFDAVKSDDGTCTLAASNISNSSKNQTAIYQNSCFEWQTDKITSDRKIEIYGVSRQKFSVPRPMIVNSNGESLDFKAFCSEWKDSLNYDEKYEFKLNFEECYKVKQVVSKIEEQGNEVVISSKIEELEDHEYNVTLYDERSEFGGIKDPIVEVKIVLEVDENCDNHASLETDGSQSDRAVTVVDSDDVALEGLFGFNNSLEEKTLYEDALENAASSMSATYSDGSYSIPSFAAFSIMLKSSPSGEESETYSGYDSYYNTSVENSFTIKSSNDIPLKDAVDIQVKKVGYDTYETLSDTNNYACHNVDEICIELKDNYNKSKLSFSFESGYYFSADSLNETLNQNGAYTINTSKYSGTCEITIEGIKLNEHEVLFKGDLVTTDNVEIYSYNKEVDDKNPLPQSYPSEGDGDFTKVSDASSYTVGDVVYFYIKATGEYSQSTSNLTFDNDVDVTPETVTDCKIIKVTIPNNNLTISINGLKLNTYPIYFYIKDENDQSFDTAIVNNAITLTVSTDKSNPNAETLTFDASNKRYSYNINRNQTLYVTAEPKQGYNGTLNYTVTYNPSEKSSDVTGNTGNNGSSISFEINLQESYDEAKVTIFGLTMNAYEFTFKLPEGIPSDAFEIYSYDRYTGYGSSLPTDIDLSTGNGFNELKCTHDENNTNACFTYTGSYNGQSRAFYMKPTTHYNKCEWKLNDEVNTSDGYNYYGNTELTPTGANSMGYAIYVLSFDSDKTYYIDDLKPNEYTITFQMSENTGYELSDRTTLYSVTHENENENKTKIKPNTNKVLSCTLPYTGNTLTYKLIPKEEYTLKGSSASDGTNSWSAADNGESITIKFTLEKDTTITVSDIPYKTYNVRTHKDLNKYGTLKYENSTLSSNADTPIRVQGITEDTPLKFKLNEGYKFAKNKSVSAYSFKVDNGQITFGETKLSNVKFEITEDSDTDGYYSITLSDNTNLTQDIAIMIETIEVDPAEVTFDCKDESLKSAITLSVLDPSNPGSKTNWGEQCTSDVFDKGNNKSYNCYIKFELNASGRYYFPHDMDVMDYITVSNSRNGYSLEKIENTNNDGDKLQSIQLVLYMSYDTTVTLKKADYQTYNFTFNMPSENSKDSEDNKDSFFADKIQIYAGGSLKNSSYDPTNQLMVFGSSNGASTNSYTFDPRKTDYLAVKILNGVNVDEGGIALKIGNESLTCNKELNGYYVFEVSGSKLEKLDNSLGNYEVSVDVSGISAKTFTFTFDVTNKDDNKKTYATVTATTGSRGTDDNKPQYTNIIYGSMVTVTFTENDGTNFNYDSGAVPLLVTKNSSGEVYDSWYESSRSDTDFKVTIPSVDCDLNFELTVNSSLTSYIFLSGPDIIEYRGVKVEGENKYKDDGVLTEALSCDRGKSCYFSVRLTNDVYDLKLLQLSQDNITIEEVENPTIEGLDASPGSYRLYKVTVPEKQNKESYNIEGSIGLKSYTVSLNTSGDFADEKEKSQATITYKNESGENIKDEILKVEHGSNARFKIEVPEECNRSEFKVIARYGDSSLETMADSSGYYVVYNVTCDLEIKVEDLKLNRYSVVFPDSEGLTFLVKGENGSYSNCTGTIQSIVHAKDCVFKVEVNEGYSWGNNVINVETSDGNKRALSANNSDEYILSDIKSDHVISVVDADILYYQVKFVPVDGVTYYSELGANITGVSLTVKYGENYEFSVNIADHYSDSVSGMYAMLNDGRGDVNSTTQKLSSTQYVIQHVAGNIEVKIGNVVKNRYTVTLTDAEGIDYYDTSGKLITGDNSVECGSNFSFSVKLYSSYADSAIRVMLGNVEMDPDDNGLYTIEEIYEFKTVTVVGIEKTAAASLVDDINKLPQTIVDSEDIALIIEASKAYNALSDSQKSEVTNYNVLENLQESLSEYHHTYNGVTVEGLGWHIKLIADPITSDIEACARIYEKLDSEYILSLYNVYLWDTLNDEKYVMSEGEVVVVHLPTPDMSYFERPTGIHESDDGKIDYLSVNMNNSTTAIETSSLSPLGIIADRSSVQGRSSLIDAVDANLSYLTDYTLNALTGKSNNSGSSSIKSSQSSNSEVQEENVETEEYKVVDKSRTTLGSALKLILILMIIGIILAIIFAFSKRKKGDKDEKSD